MGLDNLTKSEPKEACPYCGEMFKSVNRHLPYCDANPNKNQTETPKNTDIEIVFAVARNQIQNLKQDFEQLKGNFRGFPNYGNRPNLKRKIVAFEGKLDKLQELLKK
jgi:hypothetical protein